MSELTIKIKKKDGLKTELKITVPSLIVQNKKNDRFIQIAKKAKLPGFRPGKAPQNVIQQQYGNQVNQEILTELLETSYAEAVQEKELRPAGPPEVSIDQFVDGSDFTFTASIELYPEFKLKGLDKIKVDKLSTVITQTDINEMIENLQKQRGEWKSVERNSKSGDQLLIDFEGKVDGELFEGGEAKDFIMQLGQGQMLPEFDDALMNVKPDEKKEFELTFPVEYHKKELASKKAIFSVHTKEVREMDLAEINEDFVKAFGVESGETKDLMEEIKSSMEKEKEKRINTDLKTNLMNYLREKNKIDVPHTMIHSEAHAMQKDWMKQSGIEDEKQAPSLDNFEKLAKERVHLGLLVSELVLSEEIKLDDEKVKTKLEEITNAYPNSEEISKMYQQTPELMDQLKSMVMEDQVVEWLSEKTTFNEKEIEFKELMNRNL